MAFQARGWEIELVTGAFDAGRWGASFQGVGIRTYPKRNFRQLLPPWDAVTKARRRAQLARPLLEGHDLVIAHNHPSNAMLGCLRISSRTAWYCHEPPRGIHLLEANPRLAGARGRASRSPALDLLESRLARWSKPGRARAWAARRAFDIEGTLALDSILSNSEFTRANVQRVYGRDSAVVYPMINLPSSRVTRRGLDPDGLQVLVQSRLEAFKNVDLVIRGFARHAARHSGSRLHVVGEGDQRLDLEALAAELGLADRIRFHGYLRQEALESLQAACDVFALVPFDEPFGMVFPESAARGLLLIGPDHGGPVEILDQGKVGPCVDPFDPASLEEALDRICAMGDAEVEAQREAADRSCRARFSPEAVIPTLMEALGS